MRVDKPELPEQLTPQDIATTLRRTRRRVYDLLNLSPEHGGIKNYSIAGPGTARLIDRADFLAWLEARKQEKAAKFVK